MLAQSALGHPNLAAIAGGNVFLQVIFPGRFDNTNLFFVPTLRPPQTLFPGRYDDADVIFVPASISYTGGNISPVRYNNSNLFFSPVFVAFPKEPTYDYPLPDRSLDGDYGLRRHRAISSLYGGRRLIGRHGK